MDESYIRDLEQRILELEEQIQRLTVVHEGKGTTFEEWTRVYERIEKPVHANSLFCYTTFKRRLKPEDKIYMDKDGKVYFDEIVKQNED